MNMLTTKLSLFVLASTLVASMSSGVVILVDVADAGGLTTTDGSGNTWNTMTETGSGIANLLDTSGTPTGISVVQTKAWQNENTWGATGLSASDLGVLAVDSVTADGFSFRGDYLHDGSTIGQLTFSGLDVGLAYELTIFSGGNYNGNPIFNGAVAFDANGVTGGVDHVSNTTDLVVLTGIVPTGGGTIVLDMEVVDPSPNTDYAILNGFQLATVPEPATTALIIGGAILGLVLYRRRRNS